MPARRPRTSAVSLELSRRLAELSRPEKFRRECQKRWPGPSNPNRSVRSAGRNLTSSLTSEKVQTPTPACEGATHVPSQRLLHLRYTTSFVRS